MRGFVQALAVGLMVLAAGCGDDSERRVAGTPDPTHAREVARDPYALTCGDLARQPLHPESQKLVIRAEFTLAREPSLRKIRAKETLNRTGRSVYYAMTELCKRAPPELRAGATRCGRCPPRKVPRRTQPARLKSSVG